MNIRPMRSFGEMMEAARATAAKLPPLKIAVCAAEDDSSILAMEEAMRRGLARPVLIGDEPEIRRIMAGLNIDPAPYRIIDVKARADKAAKGVELIRSGEANILMKGMVPTSTFLHPIFKRENGLLSGGFISHVGVLEVPEYERFFLQTDGGLNILPTFEQMKAIIKNAVFVGHLLGMERPKVALISATESPHPKIPSTVQARELAEWARTGVPDADVQGPLALDVAVSPEAAETKGVTGPVAGAADALVAPNIETGNVTYKALRYFGHAEGAGIVVGATCPIMLTSRSDPPREKINSLALAVLYACRIAKDGCVIVRKG